MPHRLSLALLLVVVSLAACGGDDDNGEAEAPPTKTTPSPAQPHAERHGVVVTLDRASPHPGETIELTVENTTGTRLEYGVAYRLEHFVDGEWRWINRNSAFILILKIAEPGKREREDIRLPNDLRPGRYRIVKSFSAPATNREIEVAVEFTVG